MRASRACGRLRRRPPPPRRRPAPRGRRGRRPRPSRPRSAPHPPRRRQALQLQRRWPSRRPVRGSSIGGRLAGLGVDAVDLEQPGPGGGLDLLARPSRRPGPSRNRAWASSFARRTARGSAAAAAARPRPRARRRRAAPRAGPRRRLRPGLAARAASSQRSSASRRASAHGPVGGAVAGRVRRAGRPAPSRRRRRRRGGGHVVGAAGRRVKERRGGRRSRWRRPRSAAAERAAVPSASDPRRRRSGSGRRQLGPALADALGADRAAGDGLVGEATADGRPCRSAPERTGVRRSMTPRRDRGGRRRAGRRVRRGPVRRPWIAAKASSASVADRRRGTTSGATVTRTSRGAGGRHAGPRPAPRRRRRPGPVPAPGTRTRWRSRCPHLPPVAVRAECTRHLAGQRSCECGQRQPLRGRDRGSRPQSADPGSLQRVASRMVDWQGRRTRRSSVGARVRQPQGKARPRLAIDPAQEFLVQPVDASWLQCNIECQEACPVGTNCRGYLNLAAEGRFEEGYILVARAEPGRGDVLVRLLGAVRAGLPPRRHRSAARDPGDEAVPRRVARGVRHPRRHAPDHAARRAGRGRRRRTGRPRRSRASSRRRASRSRSSTACRTRGGTMLIGVPAFRLPREAIEMDVRLVERLGVTFVYNTTIGKRHHVRAAPARLRRDRDHRRRDGRGRRSTSRAPTSTASTTASTS